MPPHTDRSVSANIARIKLLRNEVYAHVTSTQVDNATFESLWQKLAQALVDMKIPQNDIDDLKTSPLGPEEETYVENLEEWKMKDDECLEVLNSIELSTNRLTTLTEEGRDEMKQLQTALQQQNDDVKSIKRSVDYLTTSTEEGHETKRLRLSALQQQNDDVKSIKRSVDYLTTSTEEGRDEMKQLQTALQQQNDDVKSIKRSVDYLTTSTEEDHETKRLHLSALQQQNEQAKEIPQSPSTRLSQLTAETKLRRIAAKEVMKISCENWQSTISKVKFNVKSGCSFLVQGSGY